jgi:hypothetical protein
MKQVEFIPFSENALRRIAQIIERKFKDVEIDNISGLPAFLDTLYPGMINIREFFARAGCERDFIIQDGPKAIFWSLTRIQSQPNGRDNLSRIIEQLCDPEEYFDDPENQEVVIKLVNVVLSRYGLKVSKAGQVLTTPGQVILDNLSESLSSIIEEREKDLSYKVDREKRLQGERKVFICYSHKDAKELQRLQVHLKPFERQGKIEHWDDTMIPAGAKWREEIEEALEAAAIAVILVSPDFLASDFISKHELPTLLSHAETRGTKILPVILSPCLFDESELEGFQPFNPPARPLKKLSRVAREETWSNLVKAIKESLERGKP